MQCGGEIPVKMISQAIYCGRTCQNRAGHLRRKPRPRPLKVHKVSRKKNRLRPCEYCGNQFEARSKARFCCRTCAARWNWAAGKTKTLPSAAPHRRPVR